MEEQRDRVSEGGKPSGHNEPARHGRQTEEEREESERRQESQGRRKMAVREAWGEQGTERPREGLIEGELERAERRERREWDVLTLAANQHFRTHGDARASGFGIHC